MLLMMIQPMASKPDQKAIRTLTSRAFLIERIEPFSPGFSGDC